MPQIAVQAIHAAQLPIKTQVPQNLHVVLCEADSATHLLKIIHQLQGKGVTLHVFQEPDLNDQITAASSEIIFDRKPFRRLKLLSKEN